MGLAVEGSDVRLILGCSGRLVGASYPSENASP